LLTNESFAFVITFLDYIVTADLSLVPNSYSVEADTYKFTSVCSATFDAVYNASENRYSNKYAAATILAIGLLCSAYIAGGKTRRLCTGNKEDVEDVENDFLEMNKREDDMESKAIEAEASTSQSNAIVPNEKIQSKRHFPDFFRRQTKSKPITEEISSIPTTADSTVDQRNVFVAL
jgi:hypothetical protein